MVLDKNVGFNQLCNGTLPGLSLQEKFLVQKLPVVSCEAERFFDQYKAFFRDNRHSMTKENVKFHCIVAMNE